MVQTVNLVENFGNILLLQVYLYNQGLENELKFAKNCSLIIMGLYEHQVYA